MFPVMLEIILSEVDLTLLTVKVIYFYSYYPVDK